MTSIILMQKLLTMKLDKSEFDRIRSQQADVKQQKRKVIQSLKRILDQQEPNRTCRLCLRPGGLSIFGRDQEFNVALNIQYILGIDIREDDGKPQHICGECERTVRRAARLKQTAETSQWRLQQELDMVAESPAAWSDAEPAGAGVAKEWCCRKCRSTFQTQEELSEHQKQPCRPERSYVCETCGLELKTMSRLNRHRLTHSGVLAHACCLCPYRARTAAALAAHAHVHSGARGARGARCADCGARFASRSNLASHRRAHRPPQLACRVCPKRFKFKAVPMPFEKHNFLTRFQALNNHMATQHSNAKPYVCNICGKAFSTRKMILRHELKAHNRPKMRSGVLPTYLRLQQEDALSLGTG